MSKQSGLGLGLTVLSSVLVLGSISIGQGQTTIVDDLSNPDDGNLTVFSSVYWANGFNTDSETRTIDEVQLSLDFPPDTTSDLVVQLWDDNASLPGNSIATLDTVANPTTAGTFTFAPVGQITLDPDTPYWIVLSVPSGNGQYVWNSSLSSSYTGVGTLGGVASYFGGSWLASAANDRALFAVTSTPIPEPQATALIVGAALAAGCFLRSRES